MRNILKTILAVVAILPLAACGSLGDSKADTPLAAPAPAVVTPAPVLETVTVTPAVAASVSTPTARIDAASFLNALVESGCEIDNAEYKEVKRGGGIKVTCTKTADLLNAGVEDL